MTSQDDFFFFFFSAGALATFPWKELAVLFQWVSPVRDLLQLHLLLTLDEFGNIMPQNSHYKRDEDNRQHDPHTDTGVQQQLGSCHVSLSQFNTVFIYNTYKLMNWHAHLLAVYYQLPVVV